MARTTAPTGVRHTWVTLYARGWPTTQIAEEYGVSYSAVRRALLRLGVTLRPPGGRSHRPT